MFPTNRNRVHLAEDLLKHAAALAGVGESLPVLKLGDLIQLESEELEAILSQLEENGAVARSEDDWELTEEGWKRGRQLLRAHRVYESYLAESTSMRPSEWHAVADVREHELDDAEVDRLSRALNRPRFDPHGDAIPTRSLEMEEHDGLLLSQVAEDGYYRILHLEDEPEEPFERTLAAGLGLGLTVLVECLQGGRYRLAWAGEATVMDSAQSASCLVGACGEFDPETLPDGNLKSLSVGGEASLHSIAPRVLGLQRRRLLDLGFVPGSCIRKEGSGAFGGPLRFRVRGTTQALRPELAALIYAKGKEGV